MSSKSGKSRRLHAIVLWTSVVAGVGSIGIALEAIRAASLKPKISTDYAQPLNDLTNSRVPTGQSRADWRELLQVTRSLSPHFPSGEETSPDVVVDALGAEEIAALRQLPSLAYAVNRWTDDTPLLVQMNRVGDETKSLRATARLLRLRLQMAIKREDHGLAAETVAQWSALTTACMTQPASGAHQSGTAIDALLSLTIRESLVNGEMTPAMAWTLLATLPRESLDDSIAPLVEATRLMTRDAAQRTFTDNGRGDGHLIQSAYVANMLAAASVSLGSDPTMAAAADERGHQASHWRNNMFKWRAPSRAACLARTEAALDEIRDDLNKPRHEQRSRRQWRTWSESRRSLEDLVFPYWIGLEWLPASSAAGAIASRHACMLQLALLMHHAAVGAYPQTLDALAPHFLDGLPHDPLNPSGAFGYRLEGEKYVLYSVGADGVDNGGRMLTERPMIALYDPDVGAGFDLAFSASVQP